jgi:hypothetical protein
LIIAAISLLKLCFALLRYVCPANVTGNWEFNWLLMQELLSKELPDAQVLVPTPGVPLEILAPSNLP